MPISSGKPSGRDDRVAPSALGPVERSIRALEHGIRIEAGTGGAAYADRRLSSSAETFIPGNGEGMADPFGQTGSGAGIERKDRSEFFAAQPAETPLRQMSCQHCAEDRENAVAGIVPMAVIDRLEVIEVEQEAARRPALEPGKEPSVVNGRMRRIENYRLTMKYKQVEADIVKHTKKSLDAATDSLMANPDLAMKFLAS